MHSTIRPLHRIPTIPPELQIARYSCPVGAEEGELYDLWVVASQCAAARAANRADVIYAMTPALGYAICLVPPLFISTKGQEAISSLWKALLLALAEALYECVIANPKWIDGYETIVVTLETIETGDECGKSDIGRWHRNQLSYFRQRLGASADQRVAGAATSASAILSVREFAMRAKVSKSLVYRLIREQTLPAAKVGASWRLQWGPAWEALQQSQVPKNRTESKGSSGDSTLGNVPGTGVRTW